MYEFYLDSRCTFWLTSTWGGGGGYGKHDRRLQGGKGGVILGQILADVICERSLRMLAQDLRLGYRSKSCCPMGLSCRLPHRSYHASAQIAGLAGDASTLLGAPPEAMQDQIVWGHFIAVLQWPLWLRERGQWETVPFSVIVSENVPGTRQTNRLVGSDQWIREV